MFSGLVHVDKFILKRAILLLVKESVKYCRRGTVIVIKVESALLSEKPKDNLINSNKVNNVGVGDESSLTFNYNSKFLFSISGNSSLNIQEDVVDNVIRGYYKDAATSLPNDVKFFWTHLGFYISSQMVIIFKSLI
jgi:hypothetical protein